VLNRIVLGLSAVMLLSAAERASAQNQTPVDRAFVQVNVGAQPQEHTINTSTAFSLYDEAATVAASQRIGSGPIFEVTGGARDYRNLAAAVAFSTFSRSGGGTVMASIPDPIFFGQPTTIATQAAGLSHSERAVHIEAVYFLPVTKRLDLAFSAGPSFIHLSQQISSVSVPAGTQSVAAASETQSGTGVGANAGVDGTYMFTRQLGIGLFLRYAAASVDLPAASNVKVGGVRTGLGFHVRF